jgi:hypothetical protein
MRTSHGLFLSMLPVTVALTMTIGEGAAALVMGLTAYAMFVAIRREIAADVRARD